MMRSICIFSILLMMSAVATFAADALPREVEDFLGSREVLGVILFASGSAVLSPSAQDEIDRLVPKLRKIDRKRHIIRIEGFSSQSPAEPCNGTLSMMRAKAVIDYISNRHHLESDLYLTGYDLQRGAGSAASGQERVEFSLYENTWDFDQFNTDKSIIR